MPSSLDQCLSQSPTVTIRNSSRLQLPTRQCMSTQMTSKTTYMPGIPVTPSRRLPQMPLNATLLLPCSPLFYWIHRCATTAWQAMPLNLPGQIRPVSWMPPVRHPSTGAFLPAHAAMHGWTSRCQDIPRMPGLRFTNSSILRCIHADLTFLA